MKSRTIIIILAVLTVLSMASGAYLYYSSVEAVAREEAKQAVFHAEILTNRISIFLSENLKTVKTMAGLKELPQALISPGEQNALNGANSILDHFQSALGVEVCYLLDNEGKGIASSNRNSADSFVGGNYAVRPYYKEAMQGKPYVYMAVGLTSKKPGAYYSYPVYKEGQTSPIGVAVIKASVDAMAEFFRQDPDEILLLTDSHGLVFLASREMYRYRMLWKMRDDELAQILASKQFGQGPFPWAGMQLKEGNEVLHESGNKYLLFQTEVENCPGWKVVSLRSA